MLMTLGLLIGAALILWLCVRIHHHSHLQPLPEQTSRRFGSAAQRSDKSIPPVIWTYWHSPQLPLVVEHCIAGWQRLNPDHTIHILHADNLTDYIDDIPQHLDRLGIAKQTDWIRLELLHRYGGIWLDSSIILTQPLSWVEQQRASTQAEFVGFFLQGYTTNPNYPVIESWFLATAPNSRFIADWLALFHREAIEGETSDYLTSLRTDNRYAALTQAISDPAYHTIHVAAQDVIQRAPAVDSPYHLHLLRAEDSAFWLHVQANWKRRPLYLRLLAATEQELPPLIKLRGGERHKLEPYLRHQFFRHNSPAARYLSSLPKRNTHTGVTGSYSGFTQDQFPGK